MSAILELRDPVLFDGAVGTELERRGYDLATSSWSADVLLHSPETVAQVQRDYVPDGADVITANTFRCHARNLGATSDSRVN